MKYLSVHAFLVGCVVSLGSVHATDYHVEFDCFHRRDPRCTSIYGHFTSIAPSHIGRWAGWASAGHRHGSRLRNRTGKTLRSIHIKIDGTDDVFTIDSRSGGSLFKEVWLKKDGKEVIFRGATIENGQYLWNRVGPSSPRAPEPYFLGRAYAKNIDIPDPNKWLRIDQHGSRATQSNRGGSKVESESLTVGKSAWKDFLTRLPPGMGRVTTYGTSRDKRYLLASTLEDELFWYDAKTQRLVNVIYPGVLPHGVNRITWKVVDGREHFVLWHHGVEAGRLQIDKPD